MFSSAHQKKNFWAAFAIILLVKCLYLSGGINLQADSYNYLHCILHTDYPAAYPLFIRILKNIWPNLWFFAMVQCVLFAFAGALFAWRMSGSRRSFHLFTAILAAEPMSGTFCNSMLSEALFIPLLLVWLVLLVTQFQKPGNWKWVVLLGLFSGGLYSVRFAALFPVAFVAFNWFFSKAHFRYAWWQIPLLALMFQVALLPFRFPQHQTFRTYRLNGIAGANIWNNASALYTPDPMTPESGDPFEKYVYNHFDTALLNTHLSIHGKQLWEPDLYFRKYITAHRFCFENRWMASDKAGALGRKIICRSPGQYMARFVWPNFAKLFYEKEHYQATYLEPDLKAHFGFEGPVHSIVYWPVYLWVLLLLLLFSGWGKYVLQIQDIRLRIWMPLLWFVMVSMPFAAATNLRYYYTFAFLFFCCVIVIAEHFMQPETHAETRV